MNFKEFGLSQELLTEIEKLGFKEPTQIQELTIPHILDWKDVIGESATGSGKTLAFGSGIVEHLLHGGGLQALVLTPTRELAEQVKNSLRQFSYKKGLKITSVYGGVSISRQISEIKKADVVVATPGRLLDHIRRKTIDLSNIQILVLDEADRMLDMGFIDDVEKIIRRCPNDRQTLFFSATISEEIKELANRYMTQPITVSAKKQVDPSKLKQVAYDVKKNMKLSLLVHLLKNETSKQAMVFCNTRRTTDFVAKTLKANGVNSIAIHGGLSQDKRTKTIKKFNNLPKGALVCTDVASRGLHIEGVSHVYNYELPNDSKDYVHRIGRTARAGEEGKVINLLSKEEKNIFGEILWKYPSFNVKKLKKPYVEKNLKIESNFRKRQSGKKHFPRAHKRGKTI